MVPLATAGLVASTFSLPSCVIRALGGYLSDHYGARRAMYWVLTSCLVCCALLIVPRMDIHSPGKGIMVKRSGTVTKVTPSETMVDDVAYAVKTEGEGISKDQSLHVLPTLRTWQEPVVKVGEKATKKQLLAGGTTHIYLQANVWVFTGLVFFIGIMMA